MHSLMPGVDLSGISRRNYWALGLALASVSALLRFEALSQTPFANGWDSYFYLVQLKSLEETGRMHSPEASLIYPYLRLFYRLTGDYVLGMKLGTAVLAGAFTAIVYLIALKRAHKPTFAWVPVAIASWSVFSPQLTYFAAQYPKNLLGLVLLVALIGGCDHIRLSRFSKPGKSWPTGISRLWIILLFLLIINYFTHRFTFVLAVAYLAFWLVFSSKSSLFKIVFSRKNLLVAGIALALLLAAGLNFPGLFHFVDFGRLAGVFKWPPQFAPYSFVRQFGMERISGWWLAEVVLVVGCWLLVAGYRLSVISYRLSVSRRNTNPKSQIPLLLLSTLLLFPFLEWSFTGMSWRFFLVFVLLTPLLVIDFQFAKWRRSGLIFAALLLCCSLFSWKSYAPKMHDPDYAQFAAVTANAQQILTEKKPDLVIAHNALAEFFTFTTNIDAMPWLPEYAVDSSRLWRIATGMQLQSLKYYAGNDYATFIKPLGFRYYLLPEYAWQAALQRAKSENDDVFLTDTGDWRNPSKQRPVWLLQRKRRY